MMRVILRTLLLFGLLIGFGVGRCVRAAEVEPFITYDHTSALTRGVPFNNRDENTQGFVGAGVTITLGARSRFEIDCAQGVKSLEGLAGTWEQGTRITVRFYPRRGL